MTLFFDINKLENQAKGNNLKFLEILENHYQVSILKKINFKKFKSINGTSYLLNPHPLFNTVTKRLDIAYTIQYIKLAARRLYNDYYMLNEIGLNITFYPDIDLNLIKYNPLLNIKQKHIYFKFEEIYNGTKLRKN